MRPQRFICFAILTDARSPPDSLAHMESSAVQEPSAKRSQTPVEMRGCLLISWEMVSADKKDDNTEKLTSDE